MQGPADLRMTTSQTVSFFQRMLIVKQLNLHEAVMPQRQSCYCRGYYESGMPLCREVGIVIIFLVCLELRIHGDFLIHLSYL